MPEIIKRGQTKAERVIGLELKCYGCKTEFRIIEGDVYRYYEAQGQRDNDGIYINCPVCGRECYEAVPGTYT